MNHNSRDDEGLGVAHEIKSPKYQPQFSLGQYWLDKTKPQQTFRLTQNAFKKLLLNFKFFLFNGIF